MSAANGHTRDPLLIAGAMRLHIERLQLEKTQAPSSFSVTRLLQLCDELERTLTTQALEHSIAIVDSDALEALQRKAGLR